MFDDVRQSACRYMHTWYMQHTYKQHLALLLTPHSVGLSRKCRLPTIAFACQHSKTEQRSLMPRSMARKKVDPLPPSRKLSTPTEEWG